MTDKETKPLEPFNLPEGSDSTSSSAPINKVLPSEDRLWAALSYWSQFVLPGVMPAILLLSDQTNKNKFLRYHAIHSLAFLIISILYLIVVAFVSLVMTMLLPIMICLVWILFLAPAVPLLWYGLQAFQGRTPEVPWLTRFLRTYHII